MGSSFMTEFLGDLSEIIAGIAKEVSPEQKKELKDAWKQSAEKFAEAIDRSVEKPNKAPATVEEKKATDECQDEPDECPCGAMDACLAELFGERQMVKPDATLVFNCPVCDEEVDMGDNFCRHCGQPIDWSDWDDEDEDEDEDEFEGDTED